MAHLPYRFGLKTLRFLLRKVCRIGIEFRPLWVQKLEPGQVALLDAVLTACEPVIALIDELYAYPSS